MLLLKILSNFYFFIISQVRVMLRVAGDPTASNFLSVDKKRKQLTLQEPGNNTSLTLASSSSSEKDHHQVAAEDRRVGVAAPKMFAFDGLFTTADDSQVLNLTAPVGPSGAIVAQEYIFVLYTTTPYFYPQIIGS
jgi:hypothetical protein